MGIDVAFSCSQKGLSCPAGLSPISISPKAWEWLERRPEVPTSWYMDLSLLAKYFEPPHVYHHTPSPPLYYAMHQTLVAIEEEGLRNRWNRHLHTNERLVAGLTKLGFQPLVTNPEERIWNLTTVIPPAGVDEAQLRRRLVEKYGSKSAGGIGQLTARSFASERWGLSRLTKTRISYWEL